MSITRELGIRHIWIDSICIVQDDRADWEKEAASMHKVYSLCLCTISASHASDGQGGCFAQRSPRFIFPCLIPLPLPINGPERYCKVHAKELEKRWRLNIMDGPLYQRAWVVQERLLSPRTLYFGKEQILWGCGQFEGCESFPDGKPPEPDDIWWQFAGDRRKFTRFLRTATTDNPLEAAWKEIVEQYSATAVTYATDRLRAFIGILTALQSRRAIPHSYGVWLDDSLPWCLLWFPDPSQSSRPKDYVAPSWSWLCLNMPIKFGNWYPSGTALVRGLRFVDCNASLGMAVDGLGQSAGLVLRCVLKVAWHRQGTYPNAMPKHILGYTKDCKEETIGTSSAAAGDIASPILASFQQKFDSLSMQDPAAITFMDTASFEYDTLDYSPQSNVVFCLPTLNHTDRVRRFEGLVLQPLPHAGLSGNAATASTSGNHTVLPTFRRVGWYHIFHTVRWVATTGELNIMLV